ncbi:AfsR/SARP family transcriptional regulator [Saccharothrix sp. ALI-22-I]|uniref:AfsR/SARP family transcriptional regulator n=1 Tax=Saccharothrix sp. ALI-22-I TaxID=1933778 RepID=UPI00117B0B9D|nr:BTAD domain-containing putative transcriptional regulator [Saccharothrix sp. ALI-22-I]
MEFNVLGPVEVVDHGLLLPLRPGKQVALLSVLLCAAGAPVSADRLLDALWNGRPPRTATENLRGYVHQLRRALGDAGRIVRRAAGYALVVHPLELDAARFEATADRGRVALSAGDPESAARLWRQALDLWRGTPFEDVDVGVVREEAARLEERRQAVLDARIEADLALGRHHDLIAELTTLVARYPLRERLREHLVLALYRAGRQGEALAVGRDGRRLLAEELGLEPGPGLRRLEQAVLAGDPALDLPVTAPVAVEDVGHPAPRQLPAHTPHFVGRTAELDRLTGLLDAGRDGPGPTAVISAINGTAGIGKTSLAVHWARRVADRFRGGQLYVNLRGFDPSGLPVDPGEALAGFLDALGVSPERVPATTEGRSALYRGLVADREVLVLLDNAHDVEQVLPLLPGSGGSFTVITSRNALVGLTTRHGARPLTLDVLDRGEAETLLVSHLGRDRLDAEPEAVRDLIGYCARLPLALAIVAARATARPAFPLRVLVEELRDERRRLDALDAGDPTTNVRAVFSWSHRQVGEQAARLFVLLGLHPGVDIGVPAVADLAGVSRERASVLLTELTRAHLLDEHAPGRLTFHDLLRAYAADRAEELPEDQRRQAVRRLFDHYVHTADRVDRVLASGHEPVALVEPDPAVRPEQPVDQAAAWSWYETEHPVLLAVIDRAAETGFEHHAWQLYHLLWTCFERRGRWQEWEEAGRTALLAASDAGDRDGQGRVHHARGWACALLARYEDAHSHLRRALGVYEQLGDPVQQARVRYAVAWTLEHQDRVPEALRHAEQALEVFRAHDHPEGVARSLNMAGWLSAKGGDHERALDHCGRALDIYLDLGDQRGAAHTWDSLAFAYHHLGRHSEAIDCYSKAIGLYRDLRDKFYEAGTLARLGDTHHAAGDQETARALWRQALAMFDDLHHPEAEQVRANLTATNPSWSDATW